MLYVGMKGGLGNQMFQYAFWYELKKTYQVQLDDTWFREHQKSVALKELVPALSFTSDDVSSIADIKATFISRVKKHFFKKPTHIIEDNSVLFDVSKLDMSKDWYLDGYWQSVKYFANSIPELKESFLPLKLYNELRLNISNRFSEKRLCSVHVRRGDYVKDAVMSCQDVSWYFLRIEEYQHKFPDSEIIIVSDDIPFCKEHFSKYNNISFCEWNKTAYEDLCTLAVCDDHILSNSTFSYWGALLSRQNGVTVYPANWFGVGDAKLRGDTMFPEEWLCEE